MITLGIDTSTRTASVAIVADGRVLAETRGERAHELLVLIDAACTAANIGAHDLQAVAIGAGPGSFTGLRIGMATAKGIAFAAKCPLWAVSSLGALAFEVLEPGSEVVAVLDARKGELYAGVYRLNGDATVLVGEERVFPPSALAAFVPPNARIVGDAIAELAGHSVTFPRTPSGAAVAKLALEGARIDVLISGAPSYIRPSEAEVKYPDGVPGALKRR
jgi:tRNA threonylcarbamoyladenosine biosynthesis protein TsaB